VIKQLIAAKQSHEKPATGHGFRAMTYCRLPMLAEYEIVHVQLIPYGGAIFPKRANSWGI
jgi:hypothetical protein